MLFDREALERQLGPPQRVLLKTLADGESESVAPVGWLLGEGTAADAAEARIPVPAVTTVRIYLTVDGDCVGFIDERPQAGQPIAERWAQRYPDQGYWQAVRDTLGDLAAWLREKAWHKEAVDRALLQATKRLRPPAEP